ncbi:MAG: DUF3347 domain-containing protein [Terrimicrobiaceae bacterium]
MKTLITATVALLALSSTAPVSADTGRPPEAAESGSPAHALPSPLQSALDQYIKIQTALASDSLKGIPEAASAIAESAKSHPGVFPDGLASQAAALAKAGDLQSARAAFKPLSVTLIKALSAQKEKTGKYFAATCPMAGAAWIQVGEKIANPYFGADMLTCGSISKGL